MQRLEDIKPFLNCRTIEVLEEAENFCSKLIVEAKKHIEDYLDENQIEKNNLCFIAVGSVGRKEALHSSDLDLIPVVVDDEYLNIFRIHDKPIRQLLTEKLGIKVSEGQDLTRCLDQNTLIDPESIGGDKDDNPSLTRRMLILTEGVQVAGSLGLNNIKSSILRAYGNSPRTSGRNILTLCNDIARYYRTLCIEYKAKIDVEDKDWGTRNAKLRHSRKFWYFSSIISIVYVAKKFLKGTNTEKYLEALLSSFNYPSYIQLFQSVQSYQFPIACDLLEYYTWFLKFMSNKGNRKFLAEVDHNTRYDFNGGPFYAVKLNSDMLHLQICKILDSFDQYTRQRIIDWFLL